jgi:tetratricopeptide (TPR) repeat protein
VSCVVATQTCCPTPARVQVRLRRARLCGKDTAGTEAGAIDPRSQLVTQLAALPPEDRGDWLLDLTRLVTTSAGAEGLLDDIFRVGSDPEPVRFAAFYGYLILQRRHKDYSRFRTVLHDHGGPFRLHPMHHALVAQSHYLGTSSADALKAALAKAEEALRLMPGNFAVKNQVAEYTALLSRCGGMAIPDELSRAISLGTEAAAESSYPRYYQTVALLYIEVRQYDLARDAIARAIDEEPSGSADYALRVADYNETRIRVDVEESLATINDAQAKAEESLQSMRTELLQVLGLFTAIIALLTLTGQVAANQPFPDAAPLLICAGGVVVLTFGFVHHTIAGRSYRALIPVTVIGLLLLVPLPLLMRAFAT